MKLNEIERNSMKLNEIDWINWMKLNEIEWNWIEIEWDWMKLNEIEWN